MFLLICGLSSSAQGSDGTTGLPSPTGSSPSATLSPLPSMTEVPREEHQLIPVLLELNLGEMNVGSILSLWAGSNLSLWVPV